jgi:Helix-turn-helix domain
MKNLEKSPLLDRAESAAYLGLKNPNTLAVWACNKRYDLPIVKIGRKAMYKKSDLDEFIKRRTIGAIEE